ncbi:MAG: glycerol-3-phosphate acyltransferase, partial [Paracoccaceae bacterium]
ARPADREALAAEVARLADRLEGAGAILKLSPAGIGPTLDEGLAPLVARGIVGADLRPTQGSADLIGFYAAPVVQRLELADAASRRT